MKLIVAVIKPFLAPSVLAAIDDSAVGDILIREVRGYGRQKDYLDEYGENEYALAFLPKVEVNVWVEDEHVEGVLQRITSAARSDAMGDGKILVLPVLRQVD